MKVYSISQSVEAKDEAQLKEKLQAFKDLNDNLSHDDFVGAVEVIVSNPEIVEFIKEVMPEDGKELSLFDYLGIAKKAYDKFA